MADNRRKRIIGKLRRQLNLDTRVGKLGRGDGEVRDRRNPGNYYVRFTQSNGTDGAPVSLPLMPNANVPPTEGLPVTVGYDASGRQVILQANVQALQGTATNNLQFNPLDIQANSFVTQTQIGTFYAARHADSDNFPFYAAVFPGIYYDGSDELQLFTGGNIDLSGEQPGAGNHGYTVVFLKTDGTLETFSSTAIGDEDPLSMADIQEAVALGTAGSIPIWAWEMRGSDTLLTVDPSRQVDLRRFVSIPSGGSGAGTVTSIAFTAAPTGIFDVSGSPVTTSGTIALSMDNQTGNTALMSPSGGGSGTPAFRAIEAADVPNLPASIITSGQLALARGGTASDLSATGPGALVQASSGAVVTVETLAATRGGTAQTAYATGDTLYASAANTLSKLAIGTAGYFLKVVAGIPAWAQLVVADISDIATTYIAKAFLDAKGDLISASADNTPVILGVGSNGQVLTADSAQTSGLSWTTTPVSSLFQHYADAGNTSTSETDLYSDTTPASTFSNNGDVINALYSGIFVASATATRQIKVYFGGTSIYDSGALSISVSDSWLCTVSIIRESSSVVRCVVDLKVGGVSVTASPTYTRVTGLTLSGTNILKITGTAAGVGAATNDIVAKSGVVLLPASASALGANTALSNLASVAINTSLISDTDNTDDLGSSAIKWRNIFANRATLEEVSAPSAPSSGDLITWADVLHNLNIISSLGQISKLLMGEVYASFNSTLNTTPVEIFTRTIKANAGGTKGRLRTEIRALIFNNSGASRTYTFSYKFDTYTATFAISLAANATQRTHVEFCIETFWDQAQNAQIHIFSVNNRGPAPAATFGTNTNQGTWETSAITTSSDITVSVELVSNSATATQSGAGVVSQSGPSNN